MSTTTSDISLSISRFIKAPRERVFEAWTNPEHLMRWFGPATCHPLSAKTDPRKGGAFHISVKTDCKGNEMTGVHGIYREFTPSSRLVFTWAWEHNPGEETLVTIDLAEVQGGTNLTLTHEGFTDEEIRDQHAYGWNGSLDKLERHAED